jgi:hypothetical protein
MKADSVWVRVWRGRVIKSGLVRLHTLCVERVNKRRQLFSSTLYPTRKPKTILLLAKFTYSLHKTTPTCPCGEGTGDVCTE